MVRDVELATPTDDYGSIQHSTNQMTRSIKQDMALEFIGTFTFVYIAIAGVNQATLTNASQMQVAACFALGLSAGILIANKSGGHLNPAVSFTTYMTSQEFGLDRMLCYIAAQILGAFCAGLMVLAVYHSAMSKTATDEMYISSFGTTKSNKSSLVSAMIDQFVGSAFLMLGICLTPNSWSKPITVGAVLGGLALFQGTNGFAFNLARDMGPRIAVSIVFGGDAFSIADYWFWVPSIVPFVGVPFGWCMAQVIKQIQ